jgi:predicted ATPase
LEVIVKTANGREHKLHELSSGEQNLLIMFTELRRKLLPGSVVLIDEIENSLHPAYQHRLAQGLLKLQQEVPYQLIVTTHAPAFVEIFGEENTRILTPF